MIPTAEKISQTRLAISSYVDLKNNRNAMTTDMLRKVFSFAAVASKSKEANTFNCKQQKLLGKPLSIILKEMASITQ